MPYSPGLHILAEIHGANKNQCENMVDMKSLLNKEIVSKNLQMVGEIYHSFPEGGYTVSIGLTESHISIHTWPEFQYVTFDVYLSNFTKNNDNTVEELCLVIQQFFQSKTIDIKRVRR